MYIALAFAFLLTLRGGRDGGAVAKPDRVGVAVANIFARSLRLNLTDAERILWAGLRDFKQAGLHFRRQAPFGKYIADFACHNAKLIVELDGDQHGADDAVIYDAERTTYLESCGYRVIRFSNGDVLRECQRVLDVILQAAASPHPKR